MDYKNMPDSELAAIMVSYIERVEHLMNIIGMTLEDMYYAPETIYREYSTLKKELNDVAHYLGLVRNYQGSKLYMGCFTPSIREAAAEGFRVPVNGKVNQAMYSAVYDAGYKLQKYLSFEEWKALM